MGKVVRTVITGAVSIITGPGRSGRTRGLRTEDFTLAGQADGSANAG